MKKGLFVLFVLSFLLVACSGYKNVETNPAVAAQPSQPIAGGQVGINVRPQESPKVNEILIEDFAFNPVALKIKKGEIVAWTNNDPATHVVVSDSVLEIKSEKMSYGDKYAHVFNETGTYPYHCQIHPGMKATIIVE